jgi:glucosylceramidase
MNSEKRIVNNKMKYIASLAVGTLLLSGLFSCKDKNTIPPDNQVPDKDSIGLAQVWLTRGDEYSLLSHEPDVTVKDTLPADWPLIKIDTNTYFQEIEGFGAALTGSSAYLIHNKLDQAKRTEILNDLFNPETGIGISYLRLTMGASDFSLSDFTYDDMPSGQTDFNLEQFSLAQDLDDIVPVLKEIIAINPSIKLMASPWSPPAWMKTNSSLKGGRLKDECYDVYADYFVKYISEMQSLGITIDAVTPQNEPLYFTASYPCMEMQADQQANFIKHNLGPKFLAGSVSTKIIIYDHNWDNTDYSISILDDADAAKYVAGTAFHAYAGNVSAMSTVRGAHPEKGIYFTEISGGGWATDFSSNLVWFMNNIFLGGTWNWSKNALLWNLALDQNSGPQNNGCSNCRGVITINSSTGAITKNEEYYSLGQISKFVRPRAERVSTIVPVNLTKITAVAFQNFDGSKVLVVCNSDESNSSEFCVRQGNKYFKYILPFKSVVSFIW